MFASPIRRIVRRGAIAGAVAIAGSLAIVSGAAAASSAGYKPLGTSTPPAKVGGFRIEKFGPDSRPDFTNVTSVTGPGGDTVKFNESVSKQTVPTTWNTWSNGYESSVYYSAADSVTLTLPSDTKAFYLYVEPNDYQTFTVTAMANRGAAQSGPVSVNGDGGAEGFAFYAKTTAAHITRIRVTCNDGTGFAFGEFGIHG